MSIYNVKRLMCVVKELRRGRYSYFSYLCFYCKYFDNYFPVIGQVRFAVSTNRNLQSIHSVLLILSHSEIVAFIFLT